MNKKKGVWLFLLAALCLFVLFGWTVMERQGGVRLTEDEPEEADTQVLEAADSGYDIDGTSRVMNYEDQALIWSDNGMALMDKKGEFKWSVSFQMQRAMVQVRGHYIAVIDRDGKDAFVYNGSKEVYAVHSENRIISGKVNDNGALTLLTEETGYKGKIEAYDPRGKLIYKWYSGTNFVADMELSGDNKTLAVTTADIADGMVSAGVMFFDITEQDAYFGEKIVDNMPVSLRILDNKRVILLTDAGLYGYNLSSGERWDYSFEGRDAKAFDIGSDKVLAVAFEDSEPVNGVYGTTVSMLNASGKVTGEYKLSESVSDLSANGDRVAVSGGRFVTVLNNRGKEVSKNNEWNRDIRTMDLLSGRNEVLLSGGGRVEWVTLH